MDLPSTMIPRATGKYFKVVDGDDWLDKSLLPQFVQLLKHTHSDVISNDFNLVDDRTKKVTKRRRQCPTLITTTGSGALREDRHGPADHYTFHDHPY